jgi:phosphoenolpyruvate carboxylase
MAMPFKRCTVLPRDTAVAIKQYCWDNISEFYRRFQKDLNISQATFYRAMSGDYSSEETVNNIMKIVEMFKIGYENKEMNAWEIKKIYVKEFLRVCKDLLQNPSLNNLGELRIFLEKHEGNLE